MRIYFAADHAGFALKELLIEKARELGHEPEDCGAYFFDETDDYPDFVLSAARRLQKDVHSGLESRAVVIGASGQGEAMAANRVKGVRCALYYGAPAGAQKDAAGKELSMLASTRMHNNANALSLGARFLSSDDAISAFTEWLALPFGSEERHVRRIEKLDTV